MTTIDSTSAPQAESLTRVEQCIAALENDDTETVRHLLYQGLDPNTVDPESSFSILSIAVALSGDNTGIVDALLGAGADPNFVPEGTRATSLVFAARFADEPAIITILTDAGADIDARVDGATPLHWALSFQAPPDIVRAFIDSGADVHATDDKNWPTLAIAINHRDADPEIVQLLLQAGADPNAGLPFNGLEDWPTAMRVLQLASAPEAANHDIVRMLVDAGADPDALNTYGLTSLMFAALITTRPENIELLLDL